MNAQDNNNEPTDSGRLGQFAVALCLIVVLLVGGAYWSAFTWGKGGRGSFSPETLQCRGRYEWNIPYTEFVIYREEYKYYTLDLVQYLIDTGYWTPADTENPTWLHCHRWKAHISGGETMIFRALSRNGEALIAWTKANPKMAKVVWPIALRLLRSSPDDAHDKVPTLLFHAQYATSIDELRELCEQDHINLD